jgi:outer membrane lipoprotein-sorting protein
MKYRVTLTSKSDEGKGGTTESLIWIDDALGMPVKSETTVTGGQMNGVKFSMELRDIRQDVDQSLFELPPDYKKVDYQEIQRQMMSSGSP